MEEEQFVSGYCRQLDGSRMVEVVLEVVTKYIQLSRLLTLLLAVLSILATKMQAKKL